MPAASDRHPTPHPAPLQPSCLGVVVHPSRDIDQPLQALREWARQHGSALVQICVPGQDRRVGTTGEAADCDLIVAIGGDGTMLAALRSGAPHGRPVLGVASGSIGALAAITITHVDAALDRFTRGEWRPRRLPALVVKHGHGADLFALNDLSVVRGGEGQVRTTVSLNGTLYARFAGDGCVVSTPIGSSAYALSAGGPLLAPDVGGFVLTPLATHGGFCPPLVVADDAELQLEFAIGHGGARLEVDGQVWGTDIGPMTVSRAEAMATTVTFDDQGPFIAGLRERGIILDSPRIVAEDGHHSIEP
jgi:NAD+ kinase